MYHLIKKNQKKLLAVFAVLLMISFVATFSVGRGGGGGGRADVLVGKIGNTPVYDSELRAARDEWSWLSRWQFRSSFGQPLKLPARLIADGITGGMQRSREEFFAELIGMQASDEIDRHPEAFLLLKHEALADGLSVSQDEANSFLKNRMGMTVNPDGSNALETTAVRDVMLIGRELEHLKNALKISQPDWQHQAAAMQSVRLKIIDFRAADFEKSVPAPTTQQAQQQFDQFKSIPPHQTSASNPLGFGYQIPARVKLQYVEIPHSEVVQAVIHTIHPKGANASIGSADAQYDWEVQAASYYNAHPDEFKNAPPPETAPATRPAQSQPATTQSAPASRPASLPAIKPFPEVKQQIIEKLSASEVENLSHQIADDLAARLASDYQVIHRANPPQIGPALPQTQPAATAPATGPTANLMMFAHLEQIRDQLQQKFQVSIQLHEMDKDWQTQADLAKLAGIGSATAGAGGATEGGAFPELAISFAHPATSAKQPSLQLWQPSPALSDAQQNTYLFRLTAAEPAQPLPDMASIAKQVEADWKLSQAYDQAMQAAQKAMASAKSVGVSQAARTAGLEVISTPLFPPGRAQEIPGYQLSDPTAAQAVAKAAADLLSQATPTDKQPDALVPLPSAGRVAVIELATAQLPEPEWIMQFSVVQQQQMTQVERLARDWFNYDLIAARTGYKPEPKS